MAEHQLSNGAARIDFQTEPARYRHWKLAIDGEIATLSLDVDEDAGLFEGYQLKLNSYDLGVDIELADALQRLRFEHPSVKAVLLRDESEIAEFLTNGFAEIEFQIRPTRQDLVLALFKVLMELFRGLKAPVVVAKGAGMLAQRIRRLALENGVPIVERKPLAQALYKQVDLNRPVPDTMYAAVAEVLAYVYQLKGKQIPRAG